MTIVYFLDELDLTDYFQAKKFLALVVGFDTPIQSLHLHQNISLNTSGDEFTYQVSWKLIH